MKKIRVPKTLVNWLIWHHRGQYSPHYVLHSYIAARIGHIHSDDAYHASCDLIKIYAVEYNLNPLTKQICSMIRTLLKKLQPFLTDDQRNNCLRMWRSIDDTLFDQMY